MIMVEIFVPWQGEFLGGSFSLYGVRYYYLVIKVIC